MSTLKPALRPLRPEIGTAGRTYWRCPACGHLNFYRWQYTFRSEQRVRCLAPPCRRRYRLAVSLWRRGVGRGRKGEEHSRLYRIV